MKFPQFLLLLAQIRFSYQVGLRSKDPEGLKAINLNIERVLSDLRFLENNGDDNVIASAWANLGFLYQMKDALFHSGSRVLQPMALECFSKALKLTDDIPLRIQVHQHRGILLKMMGKGIEAIQDHDIAYDLSSTRFDKSATRHSKSDALGMLGRVDEAIIACKEALSQRPDHISLYLPLVRLLREQNKISNEEWNLLYKEMKKALQKYMTGKFEMYDRGLSPALMKQDTSELSSDIYWALFEVIILNFFHPYILFRMFLTSLFRLQIK